MSGRHRKTRSLYPNALPRLWLMTDERIDTPRLMRAIARLPRGAGIMFRHYTLARRARRALFDTVRAAARRQGLVLILAGSARTAAAWGADGWHGRTTLGGRGRGGGRGLHSAPVHDRTEMRMAERAGADLLFLSPLFPTASHPGAVPLGRVRFAMLARQARVPVIALGGMTAQRARNARAIGAYGWAAIDGLCT